MVQTPIAPTTPGSITLEAFLKMPETQPASEYIDGQILQKPMPKGKHSRIQKRLTFKVESVLLEGSIAEAFPELRCVFGGRAIVPHIAVFQSHRIPRDEDGEIGNLFAIAPDWIIEILSPDQGHGKITSKILHCLDHGCVMGWLIVPETHEVIVYPYNDRTRSFQTPLQSSPYQHGPQPYNSPSMNCLAG